MPLQTVSFIWASRDWLECLPGLLSVFLGVIRQIDQRVLLSGVIHVRRVGLLFQIWEVGHEVRAAVLVYFRLLKLVFGERPLIVLCNACTINTFALLNASAIARCITSSC